MVSDLMALKDDKISQQKFDENLDLNKYKFNTNFKTKVQELLPDGSYTKIGNGYVTTSRRILELSKFLS